MLFADVLDLSKSDVCGSTYTNPHMLISHIVVILHLTPLLFYRQINAVIIFQFVTGWITH